MILAVRGLALALTVSLGIVTASGHGSGSAPTTTLPKTITVIVYSDPTTTSTTTTTPPVRKALHSHALGASASLDYDNVGNPLWHTWHTDPTAYKPSASDPMRSLPLSVQVVFACIRYVESRNHPNDTNQQSGTEGLYQFQPYLWRFGAGYLGIKAVSANYATPEQQSAVAVWYYNRNHGFHPEWQDGCQ